MSVWLTPEAADRLRNEMAALTAPAAVADDFGDDSLNQQHDREARIQQIQDLLQDAVIGEDPPDDDVARPGKVLTVRYDDGGDVETFLLGTRGAESDEIDVYSPDSPLGRALVGARQGEQRTYAVPNGTALTVTLLKAVPYGRHHAEDVA